MEKILIALFFSGVLLATLCSCGSNGAKQNNAQNTSSLSQTEQIDVVKSYKTPSKCADIDLTAADPSNSDMKFGFNEDGSIRVCKYSIDNQEIAITYSYSGSAITLYAFSGDVVVANEVFKAKSAFNSCIGFVEYNGYYFKGFEF